MSLVTLMARGHYKHVELCGDSITAGGAASVPVDTCGTQLMTLLPPLCTHTNIAVGGTSSFTGAYPDYGQGVWSNSIIYIAFGVNDINANIKTAQQIHDQIALNVTLAKAGGVFATVVGVPIWFSDELASGPKHTLGEDLRALMRADKCGADGIVDYPADSFFQNPANYGPELDGTGDGGLHPGTLGILRMMTALSVVLRNGLL